MSSFAQFNFDPRIVSAIERMGYKEPTPIQEKAIPVVMAGGDVMGAAQTGTGKTAGYGLPLIARVLPKANTSMSPARHPVRALILTPTRELADQVSVNLEQYASDTPLRVGVVYGGVDIRPQSDMLRRGVEILTATPGRLLDHIEQRATNLSQVEVVVLDEADRMLDMGFLPDISRILKLLPENRQNLMFSATFSPEITRLAKNFLRPNPTVVEVARQNQTAETVTQEVYQVTDREKTDVLIDILKTRGEDQGPMKQVIVFVNAKITCRRLARTLERVGINADAIHGDKTQEERQAALEGFKTGAIHVLVATDVAARGLDISHVGAVVHYHQPLTPEAYTHRNGRTARVDAAGDIYMLIGPDEDVRPFVDFDDQYYPDGSDERELRSPWTSVVISAGKKEKLSKSDILGFLTKDAGLPADHVGVITLADHYAVVAVDARDAGRVVEKGNAARIKGERRRFSFAR